MYQLINNILLEFRYCFKRKETWQWFVVLVTGFMLRNGQRGITLVISVLRLKPELYHTMMHYFRSKAYNVPNLYEKWIQTARRHVDFMKIGDRIVLLGDHIKVPKEGRRMPGVQIIHQESQNSGKGEYIEGHVHAHIGALISGSGTTRSLPLITECQQSPPRKEGTKEPDGDTLVTQMVNLGVRTTNMLDDDEKAVLVLDAYFAKASSFLAADKALDDSGRRRLEIVTRGREDTVGFTLPPPRPKGRRGAPRIYGDRVVLWELFSDVRQFKETTLTLYGKPTKTRYRCLDLLWKPLGRIVRFVVADSERGQMILMCSDLTLAPEDIITMFALRFKIETSFDEQKNDNGCFSYRFWTKALPKRKRWAKNSQPFFGEPSVLVEDAKRAIESFLCLGVISTGILTIIGFTHNRQIWKQYRGWIKTMRSVIPTIVIVKEALFQDFHAFKAAFPYLPLCSIINRMERSVDFLFDDVG